MCAEFADFRKIESIADSRLTAALELVFSRLDRQPRKLQVETALGEIETAGPENQIVLGAYRGTQLVAAIWLQLQPGGVCSLWAPGMMAGESAAIASSLIDFAVTKAVAAGSRLIQSLLETDAGAEAKWLKQCGFQHATDLLYLVSSREQFPTAAPESVLIFEPLADFDRSPAVASRLAQIVEQTYEHTLDCPAVQGMRSIDDVLASYRGVGKFDPLRWFILQRRSAEGDIGCLLLSEHPAQNQWELVYMGLVPEVRGHQLGIDVVRHAQWLCGKSAAERLVLAVDAANSPAISAYASSGFEIWDRRSVFLRFL